MHHLLVSWLAVMSSLVKMFWISSVLKVSGSQVSVNSIRWICWPTVNQQVWRPTLIQHLAHTSPTFGRHLANPLMHLAKTKLIWSALVTEWYLLYSNIDISGDKIEQYSDDWQMPEVPGGYSKEFYMGRLFPEVQPPYPFIYHFFRKGTPFVSLLLEKGTPFLYLLKKTYE